MAVPSVIIKKKFKSQGSCSWRNCLNEAQYLVFWKCAIPVHLSNLTNHNILCKKHFDEVLSLVSVDEMLVYKMKFMKPKEPKVKVIYT